MPLPLPPRQDQHGAIRRIDLCCNIREWRIGNEEAGLCCRAAGYRISVKGQHIIRADNDICSSCRFIGPQRQTANRFIQHNVQAGRPFQPRQSGRQLLQERFAQGVTGATFNRLDIDIPSASAACIKRRKPTCRQGQDQKSDCQLLGAEPSGFGSTQTYQSAFGLSRLERLS